MTFVFALTAALSAFLLFLVQPLIAKPILPLLGGSPSVWITCMVTFQLLLLLGYTYTYASSRCLAVRHQTLLHLTLFGVSLMLLPVALHTATFEAHGYPRLWLMVTLVLSVGGPYFLLSGNAPMLQLWAANTSHALARNPYPLYAASNAGSFVGLLAYPLLIEPNFSTSRQFAIFTAGYLCLVLGFLCCAILMWRNERTLAISTPVTRETSPDTRQLARWLGWSAIPASLLFGTTTFIITDIASVPLLWIIPLLLYILSFVVAFSGRKWNTHVLLVSYFPLGTLTLFYAMSGPLANRFGISRIGAIALALSALFTAAVLFHRRLYELRPRAEDSSLFYVLLALGGAIGGCFNGFIAPLIFRTAAEFPLVLAISLLVALLPGFLSPCPPRTRRFPTMVTVILLLLLVSGRLYLASALNVLDFPHVAIDGILLSVVLFTAFLVSDWVYRGPGRTLLAVVVTAVLGGYLGGASGNSWIHEERNFFGISRVRNDPGHDRRIYLHGVTVHGMQSTENAFRLSPAVSYYRPPGDIIANLPAAAAGAPIGVVGLGIGTVACYAKPGQEMDFYEIDPASIHIATDPDYFTYMRDCPGKRQIIVGDGRITLSKAPDGRYGLIIMDAFTSDAVPMHLMTLEALTMYGEKLRPDGLIAFNISNHYLNLLPVFRTLADELGWKGLYLVNLVEGDSLELSSIWLVLAKDDNNLRHMKQLPEWKPLPPESGKQYRWTDNYTNLLSILRFSDALADPR